MQDLHPALAIRGAEVQRTCFSKGLPPLAPSVLEKPEKVASTIHRASPSLERWKVAQGHSPASQMRWHRGVKKLMQPPSPQDAGLRTQPSQPSPSCGSAPQAGPSSMRCTSPSLLAMDEMAEVTEEEWEALRHLTRRGQEEPTQVLMRQRKCGCAQREDDGEMVIICPDHEAEVWRQDQVFRGSCTDGAVASYEKRIEE